jgi:hypothetical protein
MIKIVLLASLIVMALVVTQQTANAELSIKQKLWVDNAVRISKNHLSVCNSLLDNPNQNVTAMFPNMNLNVTGAMWYCDDTIITIPTIYCATTEFDKASNVELVQRFIKSGLCEDPLLSKYIGQRDLWDRVQELSTNQTTHVVVPIP